jgi:hypothetical protein
MTTKKPHWTQTEEGRKKMSDIQKLAHARVKEIKSGPGEIRSYNKKEKKETILVINGWKVRLSKNEVRIENE